MKWRLNQTTNKETSNNYSRWHMSKFSWLQMLVTQDDLHVQNILHTPISDKSLLITTAFEN